LYVGASTAALAGGVATIGGDSWVELDVQTIAVVGQQTPALLIHPGGYTGSVAAWPTEAEVRQALGMSVDAAPEAVTRALEAAKEQVQIDIGATIDEPTSSLSAAALLLAVRILKAPEAPFGIAAVFEGGGLYVARSDPNYQKLLKGSRQRFGIS
jgi:hypothetical protein